MTTTTRPSAIDPWAYRNAEEALRARRAELLLQRRAEVAALPPTARTLYARRCARAAAGVAAIACAAALPVIALASYVTTHDWESGAGLLTGVLLAAPLAAALAYAVARRFAHARFASLVT